MSYKRIINKAATSSVRLAVSRTRVSVHIDTRNQTKWHCRWHTHSPLHSLCLSFALFLTLPLLLIARSYIHWNITTPHCNGNYSVCLHLLNAFFSCLKLSLLFNSILRIFFSSSSVCFHCMEFTSQESRNKSMRLNDRKQSFFPLLLLHFQQLNETKSHLKYIEEFADTQPMSHYYHHFKCMSIKYI